MAGAAGTILVEAPTVTITGGAQISSVTTGSGNGGTVDVLFVAHRVFVARSAGLHLVRQLGERKSGLEERDVAEVGDGSDG